MDDDEDEDDMHDDGDDSFGDDGDDEMLDEGTELTTQLAAAGWQHGVVFLFCFKNLFLASPGFVQLLQGIKKIPR